MLRPWVVIGMIAGFLTGKSMRGKGFGLIGDSVVGIIGSMLAAWLAGPLGYAYGLIGLIVPATFGAILLVAAVRAIF
jgi:uncharacterized membrane protein YeaQ/YmgE (transglycosylase-associated protein family)